MEFFLNYFHWIQWIPWQFFCKKWVLNSEPFYERQRWYHSATKTQVTERIIKLTLIHASAISSVSLNSLNSLNSEKVRLHLGKTQIEMKPRSNNRNKKRQQPIKVTHVTPSVTTLTFLPVYFSENFTIAKSLATTQFSSFLRQYESICFSTTCFLYLFHFSLISWRNSCGRVLPAWIAE